jgi:hypothetical protein
MHKLNLWIPYQRRDDKSLTYVSLYNSTKIMNTDMWGPGLPTPGIIYIFPY